MDQMKVTPASSIKPATRVIELPKARTPEGEPVRVRVRGLHVNRIAPMVGGFPTNSDLEKADKAGTGTTFAEQVARINAWLKPYTEMARLGVLEPQFNFDEDDEEETAANWNDLSVDDQVAIARAIMVLSGIAAEETRELRAFPDGAARSDAGGEGGGGAVLDPGGTNGGTASPSAIGNTADRDPLSRALGS